MTEYKKGFCELTPLNYLDYPDTVEGLDQMEYDIWCRLLEQGGPSIKTTGDCMYRGPGGRRCGVGWVVGDDQFEENRTVDELRLEGIGRRQRRLNNIQEMHDSLAATNSIYAGEGKWSTLSDWTEDHFEAAFEKHKKRKPALKAIEDFKKYQESSQ